MKINRAACIPLVTHDPYFSIWSDTDTLNGGDTVHWSGLRQKIRGYITIDGTVYCFMGDPGILPIIEQKEVSVTATATTYVFENDKAVLTVRFVSPLTLDDYVLVSRPCTYIDFEVTRKAAGAKISVCLEASDDLVTPEPAELYFYQDVTPGDKVAYACMGKGRQIPLGSSGDNCTIEWGYLYLASADENAEVKGNRNDRNLRFAEEIGECGKASMVIAYDDVCSINYFGNFVRGYWTRKYPTILDAIRGAVADKAETLAKAAALDEKISAKAEEIGGRDYAYLCIMSYRHAISAHKLIADENGDIIFLSKENDSNGCIGTVDVSYPSVPLFLLFNTEYVKGMLRPVFRFAATDSWKYDFAPHDVGRYPYAWGQRYGLNAPTDEHAYSHAQGNIYFPYYLFEGAQNVFDFRYQMPVEECGNMLVMTAVVCKEDGSPEFAKPYMETLEMWSKYCIEYGEDPGNQLCTDDFAGHLNHNVNLSAKAIMGVESYSQILKMMGRDEESAKFHETAQQMAQSWEKRSLDGDHYRLTFDGEGTWSLKYNIVWDKYFGSGLFSEDVFTKEIAYYKEKNNEYGIPLDSRKTYTKSDWILWCAAFAPTKADREEMIAPIAKYLEETKTRYPFSDWYDTVSGDYCHFKGRSVQGGIFFPMFLD